MKQGKSEAHRMHDLACSTRPMDGPSARENLVAAREVAARASVAYAIGSVVRAVMGDGEEIVGVLAREYDFFGAVCVELRVGTSTRRITKDRVIGSAGRAGRLAAAKRGEAKA